MSKPKRHHWWPLAQSKHWTGATGLVYVTKADGTVFQANPVNIGVESELYTRFTEDGKDTRIEEWFAKTIDASASSMIEYLLDPTLRRRRPFRGDPEKAKEAQAVGYRINPYVEFIPLPTGIRKAIAQYIAALLVRHPDYILKLLKFHQQENPQLGDQVRDAALANMIHMFKLYCDEIQRSVIMISQRTGDAEFLYADGGLAIQEPWRQKHGIPFDIHSPLTPDIALEVLPVPFKDDLSVAHIVESTSQGVARQNRIILGAAKRFVFSRQTPPVSFIRKNLGVPAPKNIAYRIVDGQLETMFDSSRN